VSPVEVVALSHMQLLYLLDENVKACWVSELCGEFCSSGVLVCRAVYCLSGAVDSECGGLSTAKGRPIFNIVEPDVLLAALDKRERGQG
jgi:hypothetical protein